MKCLFGHKEELVSLETLIKQPYYGFKFIKCVRCGKKKIDEPFFGNGYRKGKWGDNWTDNGGVLPKAMLIDKKCPVCKRTMDKYMGNGGEYRCQPDISNIGSIDNFHFETIKAKTEDFREI